MTDSVPLDPRTPRDWSWMDAYRCDVDGTLAPRRRFTPTLRDPFTEAVLHRSRFAPCQCVSCVLANAHAAFFVAQGEAVK